MAINDGGPAFPQPLLHVDGSVISAVSQDSPDDQGLSRRDYFAAYAMAALLSQMTYGTGGQHCAMYDPNDPGHATTLAHLAYQAADAMLAAREAEPVKGSDPRD